MRKMSHWLFVLLAFGALFPGLYRNQWQMARPKKFISFQRDTESYILARMVQARQHGLLAAGGLLGWGDLQSSKITDADYLHQYDAYLTGASFTSYTVKQSNPGFQGLFFSLLDQLSPFAPAQNLRLFHALAAGLFALTLTGLCLWFLLEFGALAGGFVLAACLTSQWITLFGRNLFFFSWVFYLPLLVLLFWLRAETDGKPRSESGLFVLVFGLVLFKCLFTGYDFILPALGMVFTPIIFYRRPGAPFARRLWLTGCAALLAIVISLLILTAQNGAASGSWQAGLDFIVQTFLRRTYSPGDPANDVSIWSILGIYLSESYFDRWPVPFWLLMVLFGLGSLLVRKSPSGRALVAALWFSLLGPLSWYVIFKSLAYYHTHMNYLPWQMPFTLFGFGMCGLAVEMLVKTMLKGLNREALSAPLEKESVIPWAGEEN